MKFADRRGLTSATLAIGCLLIAACADGKPRQAGKDKNAPAEQRTKGEASLSHRDDPAEAASKAKAVPAGVEPLTDAEIEALVTGRTLSIQDLSMDRPLRRFERYQEGGILKVHLDRGVVLTGRYTIRDGRLCSLVSGRPEVCKKIYKHPDGRYLIDDPRTGGNLYQLIVK